MDVSRARRLAKEGGWILAGQIASIVGSLVLVRVLTEHLGPAQYGQLALGLTVVGLVNQVVMGGVSGGIGRFYSIAAEKDDLSGYLYASRRLIGYATAVVGGIALVLMAGLIWFGYSKWLGLAAAALVFSILSGCNSSLNGIQNAARQRSIVAFHSCLDAWLKILIAIGAMLWLGRSSTAVVLGYSLSSFLVTASQLIFLRRLIGGGNIIPSQSPANWVRQIWAYSWPFSTWGLFTWAQQVSDRWALQAFASSQEVGLYVIVYQLGYAPILLAAGLAVSFLGPMLFQRSGSGTNQKRNIEVHRTAWHMTLGTLLLTSAAFVLAFSVHKWIFHLLTASQYRSVSYLLPWMVLSAGVFAAGQILALKLMSEMKSGAMTAAKIVTAIVGIVLNLYGASRFGLHGIVASLVLFSCIYFIWIACLARHPLKSGSNVVYDQKITQ